MRQRNQIEDVSGRTRAKFAANDLLQFRALDELRDRQPAGRNYETRLQDFDFLVHPGRAISNLIRRRHAIGPAGRFAGKTATNGREINCRSNGGFVYSAKLLEPAKECLPSRVGEWAFQSGL